ncbi:hypothetical protein [Streptomyces sp. NPDC052225]
MRLGKALATGIAEEAPELPVQEPEFTEPAEGVEPAEPVEVPAAR